VSVGGAMIGGVNNYTYRAEWSYEACEYVGRCLEFPRQFSHAQTAIQAIEASEQGVSLNHWVVQKLAGREPTPSLHDLF
jgi:hypothetical protein